jgi:hypothetical protein
MRRPTRGECAARPEVVRQWRPGPGVPLGPRQRRLQVLPVPLQRRLPGPALLRRKGRVLLKLGHRVQLHTHRLRRKQQRRSGGGSGSPGSMGALAAQGPWASAVAAGCGRAVPRCQGLKQAGSETTSGRTLRRCLASASSFSWGSACPRSSSILYSSTNLRFSSSCQVGVEIRLGTGLTGSYSGTNLRSSSSCQAGQGEPPGRAAGWERPALEARSQLPHAGRRGCAARAPPFAAPLSAGR